MFLDSYNRRGMSEYITANFRRSEYQCQCGCRRDDIKDDLARRVQEVRNLVGQSITVTSGVRCEEHNADVGGSDTSSHVGGWAADLRCDNSAHRQRLLAAVFQVFDRVGIAKTFIHVDVDTNKPAAICWVY